MNIREALKTGQAVRCWINQPSTLQPLHSMHGQICIAMQEKDDLECDVVRLYFTHGPVLSMQAPILSLSPLFEGKDTELYVVSGSIYDPEEVRTQLVEASGFNDAEAKFVKAHFPEARNWDIQFNGTLASLLSNVLR